MAAVTLEGLRKASSDAVFALHPWTKAINAELHAQSRAGKFRAGCAWSELRPGVPDPSITLTKKIIANYTALGLSVDITMHGLCISWSRTGDDKPEPASDEREGDIRSEAESSLLSSSSSDEDEPAPRCSRCPRDAIYKGPTGRSFCKEHTCKACPRGAPPRITLQARSTCESCAKRTRDAREEQEEKEAKRQRTH